MSRRQAGGSPWARTRTRRRSPRPCAGWRRARRRRAATRAPAPTTGARDGGAPRREVHERVVAEHGAQRRPDGALDRVSLQPHGGEGAAACMAWKEVGAAALMAGMEAAAGAEADAARLASEDGIAIGRWGWTQSDGRDSGGGTVVPRLHYRLIK
jgi:hypothetical protein